MVGIRLWRNIALFDWKCAVRLRFLWLSGRWLLLAREGLAKEAWLEEWYSVEKKRCQRYPSDSLNFRLCMEVCSFLITVQNIVSFLPHVLDIYNW